MLTKIKLATLSLALALFGCGSGDALDEPLPGFNTGGTEPAGAGGSDTGGAESSTDTGGNAGEASTGGSEAVCYTSTLENSTAGEKVNAGSCVGVPDPFSCSFLSDLNVTTCESADYWWEIAWYGGSATTEDTYGILYGSTLDNTQGEETAIVRQSSTGAFEFSSLDDTILLGYCTVVGDVATACWY